MGLLDFLKGKASGTKTVASSTEHRDFGDYAVTLTAKLKHGPSTYVERDDSDFPIPRDTLRELKVYNERVAHPCGFDFSAVRRYKGRSGEWWLEGSNYSKACDALLSLLPYEDQSRTEHSDFPRIIDRLLEESVPYSKGADGNLVPFIARDTTKKRGTVIAAHFHVVLAEDGPSSSAVVYFDDKGDVLEARVSHYDRSSTGNWSFLVDTSKRTGKLTYKGSTFGEPMS